MLKNSDSYLRFLSFYIILHLGWLEDKQKERFCLISADLHLPISLASLDISEVWPWNPADHTPSTIICLAQTLRYKAFRSHWTTMTNPFTHNLQNCAHAIHRA